MTARAREENVEQRERAAQFGVVEIDLHFLRDEEGKAEHGIERLAEIDERRGERAARQFPDVRDFADRLQPAQHVGRGVWKKRLRVQDVGTAEEVEKRILRIRGGCHELLRPFADLRELPRVERLPCGVEFRGVRNPRVIERKRRERSVAHGQSGEETGLVIRRRLHGRTARGKQQQNTVEDDEEVLLQWRTGLWRGHAKVNRARIRRRREAAQTILSVSVRFVFQSKSTNGH